MQNNSQQDEKLRKLTTQYEGLKSIGSPDAANKLIDIAHLIKSEKPTLEKLTNLDIDVRRVIIQQQKLNLSDISNDPILSKVPSGQVNLESLGDKVGESIIDQIVLTQFESLGDKIALFNYAALNYKKELSKSIKHLLVLSHIADKPFYHHLEKIILRSDDVMYFSEKYSYNPYQGKEVLLVEAVSHLLNIVIKKEVLKSGGIIYMKDLINKYSHLIQYRHICEPNIKGVQHPIFYLVESKMWQELQDWIDNSPNILMMSDATGKNPLITTILTFSHGYVKGQEHDKLRMLQETCILHYIQGDMHKIFKGEHKIIEPQIGLFIGYLEYDKANYPKDKEIFIKTTKLYYKSLIEFFIKSDQNLKSYSFLKARINGSLLPEIDYQGIMSFWSLILRSTQVSDSPIIVSDLQINAIPKDEFVLDLYNGFIIKDKVSERGEKILDEITTAFQHYTTYSLDKNTILDTISSYSQKNNIKSLDQLRIGKDNLIGRMFNDYLRISYSDLFDYKEAIVNKLYGAIIAAVNNETFRPINFIVENPETFEMISTMGCERLLGAFENRIKLPKKVDHSSDENIEMDDFKGDIDINPTKLLKILVPSAITATWFSHKDNSDKNSYENILGVADLLNTIIRRVGRYIGEPALLINSEHDLVNEEKISYLSCKLEGVNIHTTSGLDLQFKDGKFNVIGHGVATDYIRLYNFYSAFLVKKLHLVNDFDYKDLFEIVEINSSATTNTTTDNKSLFAKKFSLGEISSNILQKAKDAVKSLPYINQIKTKPEENNIVKGINLSLLYLSNKNNQFALDEGEKDDNLSQLFNLFASLSKNHHIFHHVDNARSDLWENIRMIGAQRAKLLLSFFIDNGYLEMDQHNITSIITRCVKTSILDQDFKGLEMWLEYSIERFSSEKSMHKEIIETNVIGVKNQLQVMAIHDAMAVSIGLNIAEGVETILSKYKNFLILYRYPQLFHKYTAMPFGVVRENSKSKMMEIPQFRDSLNKIAVLLLENGYPIDLIEKCDDLKITSFIGSLVSDQVKYSMKRLAINYANSLPIPFITQFQDTAKQLLEVNYYLDIYEKSFNFLYGKTQENKIDISSFCYIFSVVLQPPDFLSRLKDITFSSGLKTDFNVKDHSQELMIQAKNVALIVKNMDEEVVKSFTVRWNALSDSIMDFSEICKYIDDNLKKPEQASLVIDINEINFFEYLYRKSQKKDSSVDIFRMKQDNSMKVLAQVGAAAITGTFIYFNNFEARNTLITIIPTIYSGLTLAGSISSTVLNTVSSTFVSVFDSFKDISYTGLYLVLAGATIYAGYKIYQGINNEKIVQLDLEMIEELVDKWQKDQQRKALPPITSRVQVHSDMSRLFKAYTGKELMNTDIFFSVINRFGITSSQLDHAGYNLKNDCDINESLATIAYAMSFAAMYQNVQRIKPLVEEIDSSSQQKFQTLLHDILAGNVTNIELAMKNLGIERLYCQDLSKLLRDGIPIISHSYNYKKSHHYLYIWANASGENLCNKVLERIDETRDSINPFLKFILVLAKEFKHCQDKKIDVKISDTSYLSLD